MVEHKEAVWLDANRKGRDRQRRRHSFLMCPTSSGRNPRTRSPITTGVAATIRAAFCVHGLTRNGNDFGVLAHALSDKYRVICPDMPGRGRSDWLKTPGDYTYPVNLADISALLRHLGIDSVDWIGTSMGGIIGMMMAGFYPNKVRRLVLNDIGAVIPVAGIHRILAYVGKLTHFSSKAEAEQVLRQIYAPFGIRDEAHWWHLFALQHGDAGQRFGAPDQRPGDRCLTDATARDR